MRNINQPIPPPWSDDTEDALRHQYHARRVASGNASPWYTRQPFPPKIVLVVLVIAAAFLIWCLTAVSLSAS
jgi:hypothetical protein